MKEREFVAKCMLYLRIEPDEDELDAENYILNVLEENGIDYQQISYEIREDE